MAEAAETTGVAAVLETLYNAGIRNELFPLLLFIGIGAMIDFGPLLSNPKTVSYKHLDVYKRQPLARSHTRRN